MSDVRILPELKVTLERVLDGEKAVPYSYPQNVGISTKLGGQPIWIQKDKTSICSDCSSPMTFVAQIDSVEHQNKLNPLSKNPIEEKQDYMFGDVGRIYVFFCFDCLTTKSVFQCF